MKLRQVYDALEHLHLAVLALSSEGAGIAGIDIPKINIGINQALTDIYNDFDVKTDEIILRLFNDRTFYKLTSDFADSNEESLEIIKWIIDSPEKPFKDDIKYIRRVSAPCCEYIGLNDHTYCESVFTPSHNTLQINKSVINKYKYLSLVYVANPILIPTNTDLDIDTIDIDLPQNMFNLLVLGACGYIFGAQGGKDSYYKSMQYKQQYELEKNKLINTGMYSESSQDNDNFNKDGWK